MSRRRSPVVGKRYPLRTVCEVWRVPRSSVYALAAVPTTEPPTSKRGPKTAQSDAEIVALIRETLATSPFHSEGHRKVRARLRPHGVRIGKARVLRLMRLHGLLAPMHPGHVNGNPAHTGRITTDSPDTLWGTDATGFWTAQDGWCWFFGAIDYATDELVGWKVTKRGYRSAALEPLYQGVRCAFGRASARTWRAGSACAATGARSTPPMRSGRSCGGSAFSTRRRSWASRSAMG